MTTYTLQFSDDAISTLAAGITASSPSLQVTAGGGALFPTLTGSQAFVATLIKAGSPTIKEVIFVTGRSGDSFTSIFRSATPLSWNAGDTVALLPTARTLYNFVQFSHLQAQPTNYALDTGTANAYVVHLSPTLNASVVGMPIRWMAAHPNTGASTFSDGINTSALITPGVGDLSANNIEAGGIYTVTWDGTTFQLIGNRWRFGQIVGLIANGQVPFSAVQQYQGGLAIAFTQLTGTLSNGQVGSGIILPGSPTTTTQALGDATTKIATTAFVNPGSSLGVTGYRRNPDGTIEQWGQVSVTSGLTGPVDVSISYPFTFPNGVILVSPTTDRRVGAAGQAVDGSNFASQKTVNGATLTIDNNGAGQFVASWRALGW